MNDNSISVLLIEDSESDALMAKRYLQKCSVGNIAVTWVGCLADGISALRERSFDLIISDLELPDSNGTETIASLHARHTKTPILALTGSSSLTGDRVSVEVIRAGATDYIPKDEITETSIARAVVYAIERHQMSEKLKEKNQLLNEINVRLEAKNERLARMYNMSQQFVDNVSHEFRTPLTVIREFAGIIKDEIDGPVTPQQDKRLDALISRTDDLANMVDDLLDTSRVESGLIKTNRKEHRLEPIVNQVIRTLQSRAAAKAIALTTDISGASLSLYCDEEKLRRILINLIVNAIKFTPARGKIEISASASDSNRAVISVADNGPGIPAMELKRIFERFQQVKTHQRMASVKGFGLGLSIARSLASLNLGHLDVSSKEGHGSTFSVSVPLADPSAVMNCYLQQRQDDVDERSGIGNVEISLSDEVLDELNLAIVDDFIRNNVTATDLVMRPNPETWQAFIKCDADQIDNFVQRLRSQWARQKRNHYGDPLPDLHFKQGTCIDFRTHPQKLVELVHPSAKASHSIEKRSEQQHILVIDDETDLATAIQLRLEAKGFIVSIANDGQAGIDTAIATQPDAICMDMRMPGMNGLEVLKNLKSNPILKSIPVVALSASSVNRDMVLEKGAAFFVQKPFHSNAVLHAVESVLEIDRQTKATEKKHNPHIRKVYSCRNEKDSQASVKETPFEQELL